jgi:hypothetical protein
LDKKYIQFYINCITYNVGLIRQSAPGANANEGAGVYTMPRYALPSAPRYAASSIPRYDTSSAEKSAVPSAALSSDAVWLSALATKPEVRLPARLVHAAQVRGRIQRDLRHCTCPSARCAGAEAGRSGGGAQQHISSIMYDARMPQR